MIAEQVVNYINNQEIATKNTDLFLGFQPDNPYNCIVIYDVSSSSDPDSQSVDIDNFDIQILVRNQSYTEARDILINLHKKLIAFSGKFEDNGNIIGYVNCVTNPSSIGKDEHGNNEWSAYYEIQVVNIGSDNRL
jgi:hypothetical protein